MKRYAAMALLALVFAAAPVQAQFLKKLEQEFMGAQGQGQQQGIIPGQRIIPGQGMMPGQSLMPAQPAQSTVVGNVNLPPGQYMMTNTQTGQAFYVAVQNGQMYMSGTTQQGTQMMAPGQSMMQPQQAPSGMGGMIKGGLGSFLKNELAPQQVPGQ